MAQHLLGVSTWNILIRGLKHMYVCNGALGSPNNAGLMHGCNLPRLDPGASTSTSKSLNDVTPLDLTSCDEEVNLLERLE